MSSLKYWILIFILTSKVVPYVRCPSLEYWILIFILTSKVVPYVIWKKKTSLSIALMNSIHIWHGQTSLSFMQLWLNWKIQQSSSAFPDLMAIKQHSELLWISKKFWSEEKLYNYGATVIWIAKNSTLPSKLENQYWF